MPPLNSNIPLQRSLLDRLTDNEPDVSTEPPWRRAHSLSELKDSVKRDLEALLNTRQVRPDLSPEFEEAAQSVLTFGLPDVTSSSIASQRDRERLRFALETAIRRFEPRLINVKVVVRQRQDESERTLQLTVDAWLRCDPEPEPVTFNTVMETVTGHCEVRADS